MNGLYSGFPKTAHGYDPDSYQLVVPSYRRPEICAKSTVRYLLGTNVDPACITVYCDDDETGEYRHAVPDDVRVVGLDNVPSIGKKRLRIHNQFMEGQPYVSMDDDVTRISDYNGKRVTDAHGLFVQLLTESRKFSARLAGLYPSGRMPDGLAPSALGLYYILGTCYTAWATHDGAFDATQAQFPEDIYRCIQCAQADGFVYRYNHAAVTSKYFLETGGHAARGRTRAKAIEAAYGVQQRFPDLVTVTVRDGMPRFRLKQPRSPRRQQ